MSFIAQFDGGQCPRCMMVIVQGERVMFNINDQLQHAQGGCDLKDDGAPDDARSETLVLWDVTAESIDRSANEDLELARVAPLGKQGKCPIHNLELPKTGICDYC